MNTKNLPLKFALFVALPIALCAFVLFQKGLKQGIDLRGGHSLVFEIRTNAREVADLQEQRTQLEQQKLALTPGADSAAIDQKIKTIDDSIKHLNDLRGAEADLPQRIIAILKNRIDKHGLLNLEWRPMGKSRIEVRMPAARKESQALKYEYLDALTKLEASNIQPSSLRRVMATTGPARQELISGMAPKESEQAKRLAELADLRDRLNQFQARIADLNKRMEAPGLAPEKAKALLDERTKVQEELDNVRVSFADKMDALQKANVNVAQLQAILRLYVSQPERESLKKDDIQAREGQFNKGLDALAAKNPPRAEAIRKVVDLYKRWADSRQGLDDPSDLKRLIAKSGVLEFRIAPQVGRDNFNAADAQKYIKDLMENGSDAGRRRNDEYLWFPVRGDRESYGSLVLGTWGGKEYVLLCNRAPHLLLRSSGQPWQLSRANAGPDELGRPAVNFEMDARGAKLFFELTNTHKERPMAILLDDEVYSAPNIKSAISDRGQITGKFTTDEVNELSRTLEAGSLPARLEVEDTPSGKMAKPISESTFGPSFGAENLRLALRAGMWGVIAVSAFMLIYYRFAGIISVFAMLMNLLLTLGAMGIMPEGAALTLPGIAGIILGVGMAVDANVLIYERLREEQEKGQSIRMALKNAYEKAFSAIFDSNITTLLSCVILGWLGSEEIRGFAITLGLSVLFNLFTAVTVTRWIFQWLLEKRLVNRPLKLSKIIGVPNIDWMGKRYYFWGFSLATLVLGLTALAWQGKDVLGIEFSSGTQSIVRFHPDAVLADPRSGKPSLANDGVVAELFTREAGLKGYEKLKDTAKVETILDPNWVSAFLAENFPEKDFPSVYADKKIALDQWKKARLDPEAFKLLDANHDGALGQAEYEKLPSNAYQIATVESDARKVSEVARAAFGQTMISRLRLDAHFAPAGKVAKLGIEVGPGGWAMITSKLVQSADPAVQDELADYEGGMALVVDRVGPAVSKSELMQRIREVRLQPDFATQLLNQTSVIDLDQGGAEPSTAFAILVKPAEPLGRNEAAWNEFTDKEAALIKTAMQREEALETTNFDAAIAGETAQKAIMAIVLGWVVMMAYLWVRFGSGKWGAAAIICIAHDLTIMVGMVALSGWLGQTSVGQALGVKPFKIDLTMVAALLTIIGYSVNDTIVVFDRIRENRGKLLTVTPTIINHSINQTLSRTILTPTTVVMTVLIMYIWGGPGIHAFNYAMLIGILFGTYSSIAVASPILMGFKQAVVYHAAAPAVPVAE